MRFKMCGYNRMIISVGIIIMLAYQVVIAVAALQYLSSNQIILNALLFVIPIPFYIAFYVDRRQFFSWIRIDKHGITNTCFACDDIFISWNDCMQVSIGKLIYWTQRNFTFGFRYSCLIPSRWDSLFHYCIYFSKSSLNPYQTDNSKQMKIGSDLLRVQYTKKAWAEVLKYVDINDIKGSDMINGKSHRIHIERR